MPSAGPSGLSGPTSVPTRFVIYCCMSVPLQQRFVVKRKQNEYFQRASNIHGRFCKVNCTVSGFTKCKTSHLADAHFQTEFIH